MDHSVPGSSVQGILRATVLECAAVPSTRGSSRPRDQTQLSYTAGRFFTISACSVGDPGSVSGLGRSAGVGISCPLQYSGLESSMDYIDHGVVKSWTQLSDFYLHFNDERVGALFEDSQAPQSKFQFNTGLRAPKSHASF